MRVSEVLTMTSPENKDERNSLIHSGVAAIFAPRGGAGGSGVVQLHMNPWHHIWHCWLTHVILKLSHASNPQASEHPTSQLSRLFLCLSWASLCRQKWDLPCFRFTFLQCHCRVTFSTIKSSFSIYVEITLNLPFDLTLCVCPYFQTPTDFTSYFILNRMKIKLFLHSSYHTSLLLFPPTQNARDFSCIFYLS